MFCPQTNNNIPRYRIGKDIHVYWSITTNKQQVSLEGRDITLFIVTPRNTQIQVTDFGVNFNILDFTYPGREQKTLGRYTLTLYENLGKEGQTVLDSVDAFELVPLTSMEDHE